VLLSAGQAQCTTSTLSVGSHAIVATYSGDNNYTGSSGSLTQVVNPVVTPTTTTLTSSLNPSIFGQAVTFTAMVSPSTGPTGTLAFTADGATLSGCGAVTLASAQAQCSTSTLAVGTHVIVATYSGDTNYSDSSGTLSQAVTSPGSGGSFTISAAPPEQYVKGGGQVSYTVTVTSVNGFAGSVTLTCAGQPSDGSCSFAQDTVTLSANGSAQTTMTVTTTTADAALVIALPSGVALAPLQAGPAVAGASTPAHKAGAGLRASETSAAAVLDFSGLAALLAGLLKRRKGARTVCLLALALLLLGMLSCGCPTTTHQTYTISITGTSGTQSASTSVALVVGQHQL
jgi:hypothetical protein